MSHFSTGLRSLLFCALLAACPYSRAQSDIDAYDPFIDYSEYETPSEEEADINFFRHGRFLTMGFSGGQRFFTEGMSDFYKDDIVLGLYLSYFFDMRFALQFGYMTGTHDFKFFDITGTVNINSVTLDIKYYVNTQNITKGLAAVNPYILGGLASVNKEINVEKISDFFSDRALGFNIGAGVEFPMMRNKMYFGLQGIYQLVNFKNEGTNQPDPNGDPSGKFFNGDFFILTGIIGVNF